MTSESFHQALQNLLGVTSFYLKDQTSRLIKHIGFWKQSLASSYPTSIYTSIAIRLYLYSSLGVYPKFQQLSTQIFVNTLVSRKKRE